MPNLQKDKKYTQESLDYTPLRIFGFVVSALVFIFVFVFLPLGDTVTYDKKAEKKTLYPLIDEPNNPYYIKKVKQRVENNAQYTLVGTTITAIDRADVISDIEHYEFSFDKPQKNKQQKRVGILAKDLTITPTDKDKPYIEIITKTPKISDATFPDIFGVRDNHVTYDYRLYVPYDELDK